jgi:hypothetical protein
MNKEKPNRGLAKWYLNCATNLNPKFTEAIELKEQISGQQATAVDASSVRGFVRRAMLNDVAPVPPTTAPTVEAPTTQPADHVAGATTQPSDETATTDMAPAMVGTEEASTSDEVSVPSQEEQTEMPEATDAITTEEQGVITDEAGSTSDDASTGEPSEEMPADVESATEPQAATEGESQSEISAEVTTLEDSQNSESGAADATTESASTESASTAGSVTESSESESAATDAQDGESLTVIPLDEVPAGTEESEQK